MSENGDADVGMISSTDLVTSVEIDLDKLQPNNVKCLINKLFLLQFLFVACYEVRQVIKFTYNILIV